MLMQLKPIILTLFLLLLINFPVQAFFSPTATPNNLFGIHMGDTTDLPAAAALVNSRGGTWGYVTVVIPETDLSIPKWQGFFDQCRRLKLIPIIRLATQVEGAGWKKPDPASSATWADFLHALNWVVANRYVVLFNEPNHAPEWGGDINPQEYAQLVRAFTTALRGKSADFFILPAGFDLAANNSVTTMDAARYFKQMAAADPEVFTLFDGWTSHSYPNPAFAAPPYQTGRTSLLGYRWELQYLAPLGLKPNLPVFITETGWDLQALSRRSNQPHLLLSSYYQSLFQTYQQDPRIVAVTPFILRYPALPYQVFSWLDPQTNQPLAHYLAVQSLPKILGEPAIYRHSRLLETNLPPELISQSGYQFFLNFQNTDQAIWDSTSTKLNLSGPAFQTLISSDTYSIEPNSDYRFTFSLTTPTEPGIYPLSFTLGYQDQPFGEAITKEIRVIPPPTLQVKLRLWFQRRSQANDLALVIYSQDRHLQTINHLSTSDGQFEVSGLQDLIPQQTYRFVLTKPYYLPRQVIVAVTSPVTNLNFPRLLPFDFYPDGQLTWIDLWHFFFHPLKSLSLLLNL